MYSLPLPVGAVLAQQCGIDAIQDIAAAADAVPCGRDLLTQGLASYTGFVTIDDAPTRQDLLGHFMRFCAAQCRSDGSNLLLILVLKPTNEEHRDGPRNARGSRISSSTSSVRRPLALGVKRPRVE
ncbi:hypothetical protein AMAG_17838 [Allomyces macrogynus ATCC 38327]|uniref:Uncharacterized protein n=1 Tax=Allomyces macrogynus (strain ATCC 38327) TaxID=578462 RepID=A0A0L0S0L6_ALLM3|nr:hypothetical protein AMAG_17838 [Allomyces macrogynus ATCC 38327]|eukprot:KNE55906.1 hypothetical protein AMAG_17838 [Allomyces macrogynus ATCC 38327]